MGGNLILLSGGMDSALCLAKYGAELAVAFDYGQPHLIEVRYSERLAKRFGADFEIVRLPKLPLVDDIVFSGRNAVLISHGAAIAHAKGLKHVVIGCNFSDAQRFPDCRPEFIKNMNAAFKEAYGVSVHAPLLTTTKAMIVREAKEYGLDTWTCYNPQVSGVQSQYCKPCGECYACKSLQS